MMRDNRQTVEQVLVTTLILNAIVALGKLAVGLMSGSLAIIADGFHSLGDGAGNVAALVANRIASQPPDDDHPYGHRRFETVGALVIGVLLLLTGWEVLKGAAVRVWNGAASPTITPSVLAVLLLTLAVNIGVSRYQRHMGRRLQSALLLADAENTAADVWVTLSVLFGAVLVWMGWPLADVAIALAVGGLIVRAGVSVLRQSGGVLVDTAPYAPQTLRACADSVGGVQAVLRARSRGPQAAAHVDIDVCVSPHLTTAQTADIAALIRERVAAHVRAAGGDVAEVEVHFAPLEAA